MLLSKTGLCLSGPDAMLMGSLELNVPSAIRATRLIRKNRKEEAMFFEVYHRTEILTGFVRAMPNQFVSLG